MSDRTGSSSAARLAVTFTLLGACATTRPRVDAEIVARSRDLFEASTRGDAKAMEEVLAPEYVYLSASGKQDRPKADEIALQVTVRIESFQIDRPRVAWLDDRSAVLHYYAHQRLRYADGRRICPYSGAMEAWSLRAGTWKLVRRTEWLIGAPPPPSCP